MACAPECGSEPMIDKLGALGMVSVFDIEEVGAEVLMNELEIGEELAKVAVDRCAAKAKVVAEQQQKDKEEKARLMKEQAEAAAKLLASGTPGEAGEAAASAILGPSSS